MSSIGPNTTLQRDQNKNLWLSAADRPNLAVLKLSRAEPLQPYFWTKSSEILDLRSLGYMDSLGTSPFCLKMFLKIGKYPNKHTTFRVKNLDLYIERGQILGVKLHTLHIHLHWPCRIHVQIIPGFFLEYDDSNRARIFHFFNNMKTYFNSSM